MAISNLTEGSNITDYRARLNEVVDAFNILSSFSQITTDNNGPLTLGQDQKNQTFGIRGTTNVNTALNGSNIEIGLNQNLSGIVSLTSTIITGTTIRATSLGIQGINGYEFPTARPVADGYILQWNQTSGAVEWVDGSGLGGGGGTWIGLSDTPNSYTGLAERLTFIAPTEDGVTTSDIFTYDTSNNRLNVRNILMADQSSQFEMGVHYYPVAPSLNDYTDNGMNIFYAGSDSNFANRSALNIVSTYSKQGGTFSEVYALQIVATPKDGATQSIDNDKYYAMGFHVSNAINSNSGPLAADSTRTDSVTGIDGSCYGYRRAPNAHLRGIDFNVDSRNGYSTSNSGADAKLDSLYGQYMSTNIEYSVVSDVVRGYQYYWDIGSSTEPESSRTTIPDFIPFEIEFRSNAGYWDLTGEFVLMKLGGLEGNLGLISGASATKVLALESTFPALSKFSGPIEINNVATNTGTVYKNSEWTEPPLALQVDNSTTQTSRALINFKMGDVTPSASAANAAILVELNGTLHKLHLFPNT